MSVLRSALRMLSHAYVTSRAASFAVDSNNVVNMTLRDSVLRAGDDCVAINSRNLVGPGSFPTRNVTIGPNVSCSELATGSCAQ